MYIGYIEPSGDIESMPDAANDHLGLERCFAFWGKQIGDHKGQVVHDKVERTCCTQAFILVDVGDNGLKGGVSCEDEEKECAQL